MTVNGNAAVLNDLVTFKSMLDGCLLRVFESFGSALSQQRDGPDYDIDAAEDMPDNSCVTFPDNGQLGRMTDRPRRGNGKTDRVFVSGMQKGSMHL